MVSKVRIRTLILYFNKEIQMGLFINQTIMISHYYKQSKILTNQSRIVQ